MADEVRYGGLKFEEAIGFFRDKLRLPTATWSDIQHGMHARAFVVAGAVKDELLSDFQASVMQAIESGTTLETFRKDFDRIVAAHGWEYNGGRNWRSRVIFETNVRTAYMAGRYKQMTDPDVIKRRPFWQYRHGDSVVPRPEHLAWNGLVLEATDPWWETHYPPNGWGCKCKVFSRSLRELARLGKTGPDKAPPVVFEEKTLGHHPGAPVVQVPKGIDPGWGYNVGEAAWGRSEALTRMEDTGPWRALDPRGPAQFGRPARVSIDAPMAKLGKPAPKGDEAALRASLSEALGGESAELTDPTGTSVTVTQAIVDHVLEKPDSRWDGREAYFPLIPELIQKPYEIWINFAVSEVSGRVALRRRYVKVIELSRNQTLGMVAELEAGQWVSATYFRGKGTAAAGLRQGKLVYGRE